ncbi:phenylalanine--tRNA ligase subunit beta [Oceanospirillum linum]|uniref:Phenylalanine--tRNA ligase beta subunit n=1 Tax=Oceanospirillum linum TaxID=966 RepID=A0A1T1HED7_OCELI|nr:phenylalanine--tRNA ligase subunit beta [Oceanospirillum linum]OOV88100.1 phenylalanine--tRNA ligase subunit beta [Oceanospirillum linum]SEF43155.1 phenylalanyl-tRNA synthetase beta subunit [Oleiphilus messinensis]SMP01250.1 phenylalanyl-tRNA synthetase beta subunit [Oceanospirillum linum]
MKFSEQWLREWVNPSITTDELESLLSLSGLEVDGVEKAAKDFSGVVVGEIISAEQHPNADKLQVCSVSDGTETFQVVCGAANARAGLKTGFAKVGAVLPGDFKIKKAKLRQVESFGMLCAEDELGISDDHGGIMELAADAPVGTDLREYLNLDDTIIEVDLTPNRSDCLSLAGLAREVGVLTQTPVNVPEVAAVPATASETFPVELINSDACPRYLGRVIKGINPTATTPLWMVEKLRRSGVRAIDPVVDVTNFVLMELGQPMHAFDLAKLSGGIKVRLAEQDEALQLLDGSEVKLNADTLVIADHDKAVAMAGIMGGEQTKVTDSTSDIFLECAFFEPISIAGRARSYGLHTDSSHRYERGVDFTLQARAMERATQLLLEIVGGEAGPVVEAVEESKLPVRNDVVLRAGRLNQMLAMDMPAEKVEDILTRLGLQLTKEGNDWRAAVPSYRFDISIEADLIEEVARVYGYDNLPVKSPTMALGIEAQPEAIKPIRMIRQSLAARGYQEAIAFSFIEPGLSKLFDPENTPIALANPISADLSVMRTTLIAGLAKAVQYNQNRQQGRIRLFETGQCFIQQGEAMVQDPMVAVIATGSREPEGWTGDSKPMDFFDLKGDLEALLDDSGILAEVRFEPAQHPALHPGQTAQILREDQVIGVIGALHPSVQKELGLKGSVYVFEIKQSALQTGNVAKFDSLSKYPEVRRDLAFILDENTPVAHLMAAMREKAGEWLKELRLFDVYQGKGVEEQRKSVALGLTWQHASRTLNDEEINSLVDQIVSVVQEQFGASLRS